VVVGDDEVLAVADADVLGTAVEQAGLQSGVDAEAVGGAALKSRREFFERGEVLGVGAHIDGGDVTDEGPQNGLAAPRAELGAGPVGEGRG
jgi:hypothetical protein